MNEISALSNLNNYMCVDVQMMGCTQICCQKHSERPCQCGSEAMETRLGMGEGYGWGLVIH